MRSGKRAAICRFIVFSLLLGASCEFLQAQLSVVTDAPDDPIQFYIFHQGQPVSVFLDTEDKSPVAMAAQSFVSDVEQVTGKRPKILDEAASLRAGQLLLVGSIGHSRLIDRLRAEKRLDTTAIEGKWESALTAVVEHPFPGVKRALVIAGSDPRGAAYALFDLSRQIGVSPWSWWADVPVSKHNSIAIRGSRLQPSPSVPYRGIFLNDEDWGLRPWAAEKMDPELKNIGPHTYARIFELLLRLRANTLWPAMHPGTLAFNAVPENALLADKWGIVMGSSHSEALLRNNVGEWDEQRDGPWNYQTNSAAIDHYWDERLKVNGKFENFYTVGMRGVHDTGLEATGSPEVKAKLVEKVMADQRQLLAKRVNPNLAQIPQVIWLYKESIDLYRVGMQVSEDVTLGWTDDNFGYIRQLPNAKERARSGGSALYYHVSYWGVPHDYLWLCTTPPALMREELTKAWDHGVRKLWILNVGDLKPSEVDMDYFLRMAWDEPGTARLSQHDFLLAWNAEQFPKKNAAAITELMERAYRLNFVRKPEFMGFNGYTDQIKRTAFNPMAWGDQNRQRLTAWQQLNDDTEALGKQLGSEYRDEYFELVGYPVEAAAAHNAKLLWNDRSYLDKGDHAKSQAAYDRVQELTAQYNHLAGGKWEGMMSSHPRARHVFEMPQGPMQGESFVPPATWGAGSAPTKSSPGKGFVEEQGTVSIEAAHFSAKLDGGNAVWHVDPELGLPGSVVFGAPGEMKEAAWVHETQPSADTPWLEYSFTTASEGDATLSLFLLPTFAVDSDHGLRYAVRVDDGSSVVLDARGSEEGVSNVSSWSSNVLRNAAIQTLPLKNLRAGKHTMRLIYGDPGVIFEHLTVTFPGAPPAYPFARETSK